MTNKEYQEVKKKPLGVPKLVEKEEGREEKKSRKIYCLFHPEMQHGMDHELEIEGTKVNMINGIVKTTDNRVSEGLKRLGYIFSHEKDI
jgi:hypothetical protein